MTILKSNNSKTITLNGREVTLRNLQSIMPNSKALIISRLLYCLSSSKFVVYDDGIPYIRKSPNEWVRELEIWFGNGNRKQMSRSTVYKAFRELVEDGLVSCMVDRSRTRMYSVNVNSIDNMLKDKIGIDSDCSPLERLERTGQGSNENRNSPKDHLDSSQERTGQGSIESRNPPKDQLGNSQESNGQGSNENHDTLIKEMHAKCTKNTLKVDTKCTQNRHKIHKETQETQGVHGHSEIPTYTDTDTSTHTHDLSVENEKNLHIVREMFEVWKDEFPDSNEKLNIFTASLLNTAFRIIGKNLSSFRLYLKIVKTSEFIMKRPHLLKMKWLLKFETMDNVGRGGYEVCKQPPTQGPSSEPSSENEDEEIGEIDEDDVCRKLRLRILRKIGRGCYRSWFSKVSMESIDTGNGSYEIKYTGPRFNVDRITTHYREFLFVKSNEENKEAS
jgi:hypothetical protein